MKNPIHPEFQDFLVLGCPFSARNVPFYGGHRHWTERGKRPEAAKKQWGYGVMEGSGKRDGWKQKIEGGHRHDKKV